MNFPENLKYSKEHEWTLQTADTATVGITDFAQSELGDVVYVELPSIGATVKASEKFGEIESVKSVSNLYSPVSGEIIEINEQLNDNPQLVNESPYADGWLIKIKISDPADLSKLLNAGEYKQIVQ